MTSLVLFSYFPACTAPVTSFETGWDGYVNDRGTKSETSDWVRKRAGTAVDETPSVDHTTGLSSGKIMHSMVKPSMTFDLFGMFTSSLFKTAASRQF